MEVYTVYIICNPQKIYYKGFTSDELSQKDDETLEALYIEYIVLAEDYV